MTHSECTLSYSGEELTDRQTDEHQHRLKPLPLCGRGLTNARCKPAICYTAN